jgi:mannose-1-phosphate guanylyltransferase
MPKQFVKLFDNKSLLQLTVERNAKACENQLIVSNTEQYFLALDQMSELDCVIPCQAENNERNQTPKTTYLLEPIGRNTAPAIALACMSLNPDEIVLVTPSDHLIKKEAIYQGAIQKAKNLALENNLVTFGIMPTSPETGFGYIEADGLHVKAFHEKPDTQTAKQYIKNGNYYWNSGIFMFKAGVYLEELKLHASQIYSTCKEAFENTKLQNETLRIEHSLMEAIPSDSIDYAVMEKSNKVKVIPSDIGWSDLGSFDSLYHELTRDDCGNATLLLEGQCPSSPITIDSKNNLIISQKQIVSIDIEDSIIIDTGDALLVSKKGSSQKVKEAVKQLVNNNSQLTDIHLTGYRPWGSYTILEDAPGYKIKRIEVKPGKRLSLQKHFHRNEHWIVVSGCATVTIEEKTFILNPNESTYIKAGQLHRLENQGRLPLVIIEAQVGEYTGEDDIVRIEDDYKRQGQ